MRELIALVGLFPRDIAWGGVVWQESSHLTIFSFPFTQAAVRLSTSTRLSHVCRLHHLDPADHHD